MAKLGHHVYFTLKVRDQASTDHLIAQCEKYLSGHDGLSHFSVGVRERDLDREVNGDFDVSLHMVFVDRATQDKYQVSQRHQEFIQANQETWGNVVVYDTNVVNES